MRDVLAVHFGKEREERGAFFVGELRVERVECEDGAQVCFCEH